MEIFKLVGSIFVDSAQANSSIQATDKSAEGLGSRLASGISTAAKFGAGLVAAAGAGAAALAGMAVKTAAVTDNIDKMSQKIGISRQAYQELDFICSQSGTSVDNLKAGIKTLTNQMQSASEGSKTATAAFDALGLSWEDGNGKLKSQEEMMWEAMSALQGMDDQTQKAALAVDLFGKAGTELMPMLNGAEGSIEAMKQQAHDLGLVLSDDAIDAGVVFTDTVDQAKRSLEAITVKIGAGVMPIFQQLLDWVMVNMPMIQEVMTTVFGGIELLVTTVGTVLQTIFQGFTSAAEESGITFETVFATVQSVFETVCTVLQDLWTTLGQPIFDSIMLIVGTVGDYFASKMPEMSQFFTQMVTDISTIWENNLKPCFDAIGQFIQNVLAPAFVFVFDTVIAPAVDSAFKAIQTLWEGTLKPVFTGITDFITGVFTGNWQMAFDGLSSIVSGAFNGMITLAKTPLNTIIGIINKFISRINGIQLPDWVPGVGGKSVNISEIPLLAKGGTALMSGQAIVGDAGPELIDLPAGAKVRPLSSSDSLLGGGGQTEELLSQMLDLLGSYLPKMGSGQVVLDTGVVAGAMTPKVDKNLNRFETDGKRGN